MARIRWSAAVAASFAIALSIAPGASVLAADEGAPEDVPDGMQWDPQHGLRDDTLAIDAGAVAEDTGRSKSYVLKLLRAQARMDSLLSEALERYPELVSIYWTDDGSVVAQYTGNLPDAALALLRESGADVTAKRAKYSRAELNKLRAQVDDAVGTAVEDVNDRVIAVDPTAQKVYVTISARADTKARDVLSLLPEGVDRDDVVVSVVDGPVFVDHIQVRGGTEMFVLPSLEVECTPGFSVFQGTTNGVATAGHCPNASMDVLGDPFVGDVEEATYKNGHLASWGDFQWHTTTGTEVDDFYMTNAGGIRDVAGIKNTFSDQETVLAYGRGGPKQYSATVHWIDVSIGSAGHQVCTIENRTVQGDSGGPVFVGNSAAGFIKGLGIIDGGLRFCFSQAKFIDDAISVSIKTN